VKILLDIDRVLHREEMSPAEADLGS
jgi:hypothetical protein